MHPDYVKKASVTAAVEALNTVQERTGRWRRPVPFYQTVNALAHLQQKEVDVQLDRAFRYLFETQNSDGTWGRADPEWNSFLVVHAMKNKKLL